jgi:cytochrome c-type biogenesis protein CcmH
MKQFICSCIFLFSFLSLAQAQDLYHFDTAAQQKTFTELTENLRCLVCQNQNLADSNASLAKDLRRQIYQQVLQGQNVSQIQHYMIERYGDFILFKPPLNTNTLFLWFGPFVVLVLGFLVLLTVIKKHRHLHSS